MEITKNMLDSCGSETVYPGEPKLCPSQGTATVWEGRTTNHLHLPPRWRRWGHSFLSFPLQSWCAVWIWFSIHSFPRWLGETLYKLLCWPDAWCLCPWCWSNKLLFFCLLFPSSYSSSTSSPLCLFLCLSSNFISLSHILLMFPASLCISDILKAECLSSFALFTLSMCWQF